LKGIGKIVPFPRREIGKLVRIVSYVTVIRVALGTRMESSGKREKYDNIENAVCFFGTYPKSF